MRPENQETWDLEHIRAVPNELYFFCFYQIQVRKEKLYHHVIIKAEAEKDIVKNLITKDYQYFLRAVSPLHLSKDAKENAVIKHLIFDGESLVARMKQKSFSNNQNQPSQTNESN